MGWESHGDGVGEIGPARSAETRARCTHGVSPPHPCLLQPGPAGLLPGCRNRLSAGWWQKRQNLPNQRSALVEGRWGRGQAALAGRVGRHFPWQQNHSKEAWLPRAPHCRGGGDRSSWGPALGGCPLPGALVWVKLSALVSGCPESSTASPS